MGSQFGFYRKARAMHGVMKAAFDRMAKETIAHFKENFDSESFNSRKWDALDPVTRNSKTQGLPILNVTGKLKQSVIDGLIEINSKGFRMNADPIDDRGRSYANYHNEGTGIKGQGFAYNPKRPFMKQDDKLTTLQLKILNQETGKVWEVK